MGNASSSSSGNNSHYANHSGGGKSSSRGGNHHSNSSNSNTTDNVTARAQKVMSEMQANIQSGIQQLEDQDHPAAHLIDSICRPYLGGGDDDVGVVVGTADSNSHSSSGGDNNKHHKSKTKKKNNSSSSSSHNKARSSSHKKNHRYDDDFYSLDEEDDEEEEEDVSFSENDSRTLSEDETTTTTTDYHGGRRRSNRRTRGGGGSSNPKYRSREDEDETMESASSYLSSQQSDYESSLLLRDSGGKGRSSKSTTTDESSYNDDDDGGGGDYVGDGGEVGEDESYKKGGVVTQEEIMPSSHQKPLASAFAKRCYFTKAGIGKTTQHYEGLTLTGNVVLMLAAAMKLKGCPTICDEDLRRVEQTYPNQFSRLPDELLLSSGWRRISKYCHFSNKPIPDGVPFFHSKQRLHPNGGYYFLLAAAVGMVRPTDVELLNRDTLVLLETDYPTACDAAPTVLIQDPTQWTLVDKFCFFSGGPINTDEDVYYQADFDGNAIYMLAFLSPSLTPAELYKLDHPVGQGGLETVAAVQEVESVYDLTERDFDDLKLYHLGPCRALPPYILQPSAWTKVLPPHFLETREAALMRAVDYDPNIHAMMHPQGMHPYHQEGMMPYPADPAMSPYSMEQQPSPQGMPMPHPAVDQLLPPGIAPYPMDQHQLPPGMHPYPMEHQSPPHEQANYYNSLAGYAYPQMPVGYESPQQPPLSSPQHLSGMQHMEPLPPTASAHHSPADPQMTMTEVPVQHDPADHTRTDAPQKMEEPLRVPAPSQPEDAPTGALIDADDYDGDSSTPMDEAHDAVVARQGASQISIDPPEDEPPTLKKDESDVASPSGESELSDERPAAKHAAQHPVENSGGERHDYYYTADETEEFPVPPTNENEHVSRPRGNRPSLEIDPQASEDYSQAPSEFTNSVFSASSPLPPKSPASEFSPSSAMKGAQDMLGRNRQRRVLEAARRRQEAKHSDGPDDEDASGTDMVMSPRSDSESTWESGMTSEVSGSSVWTDNATNPDRSSRRALILQMAKARMRSNKSGPTTPSEASAGEHQDEKKIDSQRDVPDIDLTGDLD